MLKNFLKKKMCLEPEYILQQMAQNQTHFKKVELVVNRLINILDHFDYKWEIESLKLWQSHGKPTYQYDQFDLN